MADNNQFDRIKGGGGAQIPIPPFPEYPPDVKKRFPSLAEHEKRVEDWRKKVIVILQTGKVV